MVAHALCLPVLIVPPESGPSRPPVLYVKKPFHYAAIGTQMHGRAAFYARFLTIGECGVHPFQHIGEHRWRTCQIDTFEAFAFYTEQRALVEIHAGFGAHEVP